MAEVYHNREINEYLDDLDNGDGTAEVSEYIYSETGSRISTEFKKRYPVSGQDRYKSEILKELIGNELINETEVEQFFEYLDYNEALEVRFYFNTLKPKNPYPLQLQTKQQEAELTEVAIKESRRSRGAKSSAVIIKPTGCPTITDIIPKYMGARKWYCIRNKTKQYTPSYIFKC